MPRPLVPIAQLDRRLPEAGRIRIGTSTPARGRNGKEYRKPEKLDRFRFTSRDRTVLDELARHHGGQVQPWTNAPDGGQWEVVCDDAEIPIMLPPDPLGGTPVYELWEAGGCQRRCDGVTAEVPQAGPDGTDLVRVDCLCAAAGALSCKVTTRLNVLLPHVRFAGAWRLETHGFHAAQELPGMVDVVQQLQDQGITRARLAVEQRRQKVMGQTRDFMVPVIRLAESPDAIVSGRALVSGDVTGGAIDAPARTALEAGPPAAVVEDDEVVDAEVVEDRPPPPEPPDERPAGAPWRMTADQRKLLMATLADARVDDDRMRHDLVRFVTAGRTDSTTDLERLDFDALLMLAGAIRDDTVVVDYGPEGELILQRAGTPDTVNLEKLREDAKAGRS